MSVEFNYTPAHNIYALAIIYAHASDPTTDAIERLLAHYSWMNANNKISYGVGCIQSDRKCCAHGDDCKKVGCICLCYTPAKPDSFKQLRRQINIYNKCVATGCFSTKLMYRVLSRSIKMSIVSANWP